MAEERKVTSFDSGVASGDVETGGMQAVSEEELLEQLGQKEKLRVAFNKFVDDHGEVYASGEHEGRFFAVTSQDAEEAYYLDGEKWKKGENPLAAPADQG